MAEENTSTLLISIEKSALWSHGQVVRGRTFSLQEVGVQLGSNSDATTPFFFFFLSSFFYPLVFYCFSLLNPLASRDFCENIFLVVNIIVNSYCPAQKSIFANCVKKETVTCCMKFIQFNSSFIIFACVVLNIKIVLLLLLIYLFMVLSNSILSLFLYPFSYPFSCRALRER